MFTPLDEIDPEIAAKIRQHIQEILKQHKDERMSRMVLENDPELHEVVTHVQEKYEIPNFTTTLFVLAWVGAEDLREHPNYLKNSGIHDVLK